jgi:tetratricopeptide (TPR) repeat protein
LLLGLLAAGAVAGALLAYVLTRGGGGTTPPPTTVVTQVQTVTTQGQTTTVEKPATVTTAPATTAPSEPSGVALNNAGFRKMQQGDYAGALPLLERAVQKLEGTGSPDEAYASYNLAYTRFQLGNCDGVLELLDRSETIQGHRSEIDQLRQQAEDRC